MLIDAKLLPLQGALLIAIIPRAMPWARSFWAFSPYLNRMRNFSKELKKDALPNNPQCIFFLYMIFLSQSFYT